MTLGKCLIKQFTKYNQQDGNRELAFPIFCFNKTF